VPDVMEKYNHCRVCGEKLNPDTAAWARRQFEQKTCSAECQRREIKARFACCDRAEPHPCVCMYAFTCPTHGITHNGTHD